MKQKNDFLAGAVHIFVLCSFAIAQPLFDLLGRTAEFFVVRRSEPVDVFLLIFILCVLIPGLIIFVEAAAGLLGGRVRKAVHGIALACLAAAIALQALKRVSDLPGVSLVVGAVLLGVALAAGYLRFPSFRFYLNVLSPAVLLFPGLFLFHSPVFKVAFPRQNSSVAAAKVNATAPVVIVVFDELPVTSLMDEHRQIDPVRYPNFAALAEDATWFRNATTVGDFTTEALPAILTGAYPDRSRQPTAADYPRNIFTLLGGSYRLKVSEAVTQLCPDVLCEKQEEKLAKRMASLLSDLSIVYLHILLPIDLSAALPPITQNWRDFAANAVKAQNDATWRDLWQERARRDRAQQFMEFINGIDSVSQPTLYFLHILLPHSPNNYLPSGKIYTLDRYCCFGVSAKDRNKWSDDERAVLQNYQRHLLQVGFVDTLIGRLLARLKAVDLYHRSLIVVTADHGISFRKGDYTRKLTKTNFQDIMPVPLFIKAPNQHEGIIDDRNMETIDILPTMADILDIDLPWSTDGDSALDHSSPARKTKTIVMRYKETDFLGDAKHRMTFDSRIFEAKYAAIKRKLVLFGSGANADRLLKIGPYSQLVGRHVVDVGVVGEANARISLNLPALYTDVDPKGGFLPAYFTGHVFSGWNAKSPLNLAVAINGTIRATTQTYTHPERRKTGVWSVVVDEASFRAGQNDVEVFVITSSRGKLVLERAYSQAHPSHYRNLAIVAAKWIWGVEESGFYDQEWGREKVFRWTNGAAKLVVPIKESSPPQALQVDLVATGPNGTRLTVLVNGSEIFDEAIAAGSWSNTFSLTGRSFKERVMIELLSDTFVPREVNKNSVDFRTLGVAVSGIHLLDSNFLESGTMAIPRTYRNVVLGAKWIQGVSESGFHGQEWRNEKPFRWTNGVASLVVPIEEGSPPRALRVDLVATGPSGTRLTVLVNGSEIFDGPIAAGGWSNTFSLTGRSFKDRVMIELLSDTFVPNEISKSSRDSRTLGVAVTGITLLDGDPTLQP